MVRRTIHLLTLVGLVCLVASACGYTPQRYATESGSKTRVAVKSLRNDTYQPGVDLLVSDAIRRQLLSRGGMRMVADPEAADVVISGKVSSIRTRSKSVSSVVLALEFTATMTLDLDLDMKNGVRVKLDPGTFRDSEIYLASADVEAGRKNRIEALRRLASLLAVRVLDTIEREVAR